jgi:hypothetical protein
VASDTPLTDQVVVGDTPPAGKVVSPHTPLTDQVVVGDTPPSLEVVYENAKVVALHTPEVVALHTPEVVALHTPTLDNIDNIDNITVDKKKKKDPVPKTSLKEKVDQLAQELKPHYPALNFDHELMKFKAYWFEGQKQLKIPKLALINWMDKAIKDSCAAPAGGHYGKYQGYSKGHGVKLHSNTTEELLASWGPDGQGFPPGADC